MTATVARNFAQGPDVGFVGSVIYTVTSVGLSALLPPRTMYIGFNYGLWAGGG